MGKTTKQFKKFASSGKLKDTIRARRQHQQIRQKTETRIAHRAKQRGAPRAEHGEGSDEEGDERDSRAIQRGGRAGGIDKTLDEVFEGGLEVDEEGSELEELSDEEDDDDEEEEEEEEGGQDGGMLDEKEMEKAMKDLEKKDPEFYKYLRENDSELLEFKKGKEKDDEMLDEDEDEDAGEDDDDVADDDEMEVEEGRKKISVTMKMLRQWQEAMLKQHSIRSLKSTLLAFRAAAHMNEDDADQGSGRDTKYSIDSAAVFNKLVITALKFTPVVLAHHMPYKALPNGRFKLHQAKKSAQPLNRLVLSHLSTLLHLIKSLPSSSTEDSGLVLTAIGESSKLLPWILGARKHVRAYLKVMLDLWSSAGDEVRIASFLAVRRLFVAGDEGIKDLCLKNTYRSLLPPLRNTTPHTLPSINLMKNTAASLYQISPAQSYTHAFGAIRMLAVHLRNVVRASTSGKAGENQEAFRSVYNWQYVHCLDFWSLVLGAACAKGVEGEELKPLIYPLVQIALGVVRLLPSSRYFPLRFHILHSLISLSRKTSTYIPLSPFLLEILSSSEFHSHPKSSSLKPLDLEYIIRAPAQYPKTKIYQECLSEELIFLLADHLSSFSTHVAFPELSLPVVMTLRKHLKKGTAGGAKSQNLIKGLVERIEETRKWVEGKRRNVGFAPKDLGEVRRFLGDTEEDKTPLGGWMRVQRKMRDKRRLEVERALREEGDESE
ncbi:hypothetical protein TREMEDRAFT_35338 [Tremella mesenterica DSM 1558]|uniref:uncharacterized protein n=1 Tax=Tremella mesenterica (strain ATCC 24925 / CBS 8224 / DSM 1558 / NBRC 9311 / NRRL Y-6157 / RJB 2259-6 / UBC 559-6) TaxID=578456 RepID=UPI00032D51BA|nr:uncharacterized protein TREMEDRAFT_35338 [Tremella mesenterica DSM 1558]EIW66183.1 hypothetical protein TREMEDRAFT_35338 [Tremella mesenterica DSM 1558]